MDRFEAKFVRGEGCWEWTAAKDKNGYGKFRFLGKTQLAHRVAYELYVGPVPDELTLDHLCRNPGCVNPEHLEAVTHRENMVRGEGFPGRLARATHCKWGHPFDAANTYWKKRNGVRECRRCKADRERERRLRERV